MLSVVTLQPKPQRKARLVSLATDARETESTGLGWSPSLAHSVAELVSGAVILMVLQQCRPLYLFFVPFSGVPFKIGLLGMILYT